MLKAEMVEVIEDMGNGVTQSCPAIQLGEYVIFADNGDAVSVHEDHIKVVHHLKWIDISEAILGT